MDGRISRPASHNGRAIHADAGTATRWSWDTTNFTDKTRFQGSGTGLHVVERFRRTNVRTLQYDFTVEDPASFASPWAGRLDMTRTDDRLYEYACHEGNSAMPGMLRGARCGEKDR